MITKFFNILNSQAQFPGLFSIIIFFCVSLFHNNKFKKNNKQKERKRILFINND
jgi:hypothetical protein